MLKGFIVQRRHRGRHGSLNDPSDTVCPQHPSLLHGNAGAANRSPLVVSCSVGRRSSRHHHYHRSDRCCDSGDDLLTPGSNRQRPRCGRTSQSREDAQLTSGGAAYHPLPGSSHAVAMVTGADELGARRRLQAAPRLNHANMLTLGLPE